VRAFCGETDTNSPSASHHATPSPPADPLLRLQNDLPLAIRYDAYVQALTNPASNQSASIFRRLGVIKLLSGGQVSDKIKLLRVLPDDRRWSDRRLEDAWLQFTDIAGSGVSLQVGQFQVSDPMFKRETATGVRGLPGISREGWTRDC
jgi:hypothetical protein